MVTQQKAAQMMDRSVSQEDSRTLPFKGIRVLDFTCNAAGPYGVWLLGQLGADIVKVESRSRPDPARGLADRPYAHSVFFEDINGGKRSISVDMKAAAERDRLLDVVDHFDAVVDSFRPGVMDRLGFGASAILDRQPRAVVASLSATGSSGPYAGLPGFAGIFNALGGLGSVTGYENGPPTELRTSIDLRSGALFASLIGWSLREAARTGQGRWIDFSAVEAVSLLAGEQLTAALLGTPAPDRIGNRDEEWAPQGVWAAGDGTWIALTVRSDQEWSELAGLGRERGLDSPTEWAHLPARRDASDLDTFMGKLIGGMNRDEAVAELDRRRIAAEPVLDAAEVSGDAQLAATDFFHAVEGLRDVGWQQVAAAPWIADGVRTPVGPPCELGAATDAVFAELRSETPRTKTAAPSPADGSLRVLELGVGAAVPMAGRMFSSFGADVRKVELGPDGDWTRAKHPIAEVGDCRAGALFHFLNAGKESILVPSEDALGCIGEQLAWAEIVLVDEVFLAIDGVAEQLDRPGPRAVTTVTPFGLTGPNAGRPASAATLFARCGEGGITPGGLGHQMFPDASPLVARGKLTELDAGIVATLVSVAAVHGAQEAEGYPIRHDVSIHEVSVSNNRWIPGNFTRSGWVETRGARPYPYGGLLPCKDGYAMFLPSTDRHWAAFVDIMGRPDWALDDEFSTYAGRAHNAAVVRAGIIDWAAKKTKAELLDLGLRHGVPMGPYRSADEVARCPQLIDRGFLVRYGGVDGINIPGLPAPGLSAERGIDIAPPLATAPQQALAGRTT